VIDRGASPTRALLALLACSGLTAGAAEKHKMDCAFDEPSYAPIRGTFDIQYRGWAGTAPRNAIRMNVKNASDEAIYLQGCGYEGDNFWWVESGLLIPAAAPRPAAFDNDDDHAPQANAFLMNCGDDDCAKNERRTWFDHAGATGAFHEYDGTAGVLRADYTLTEVPSGSTITESVTIHADCTWASQVPPAA